MESVPVWSAPLLEAATDSLRVTSPNEKSAAEQPTGRPVTGPSCTTLPTVTADEDESFWTWNVIVAEPPGYRAAPVSVTTSVTPLSVPTVAVPAPVPDAVQ